MTLFKKLTNILNKFSMLELFILFSPFVDMVYSVIIKETGFNSYLSLIYRSIFLIILLFYVIKNKLLNKKTMYFLLILLGIFGVFIINRVISGTELYFFEQIKAFFKYFYFIIVCVLLIPIFKKNKNIFDFKTLFYLGLIYAFFVLIPYILGYYYLSYSNGRGSKGLLFAANEISSLLAIISPFVLYYLCKIKNNMWFLILEIFYVYSTILVGTKTTLVGLILSIIGLFIYYFFNKLTIVNKKDFLTKLLIVFLTTLLTILFTDSALYIFFDTALEDTTYAIFSSRNEFVNYMNVIWNSLTFNDKLFGFGSIIFGGELTVEIDFYNVFYIFGVFGLIYYLLFILKVSLNIIKNFFKQKKDVFAFLGLISIGIGISVSMIAGHTFSQPLASIYLSLIIAKLYTWKGAL